MKADSSLADLVLDMLQPLGGVTRRYMFGGWGFYREGLFFALIADGRFYLKTGPVNVREFEEAGLAPWVYESSKGPMRMCYHEAPEAVLTNPSMMKVWARKGLSAAVEAAAAKARKPKRAAGTETKASPEGTGAAKKKSAARPSRKRRSDS